MADKTLRIIDALIAKRENTFANVTRICDKVARLGVEDTAELEVCVDTVLAYQARFAEIQDALIDAYTQLPADQRISVTPVDEAFQDLVIRVRARHRDVQQLYARSVQAPLPPTPRASATLPSISLPSFDGQLDQWPAFIALFDTLVHQESALSPAVKLQYLQASLRGEARSVIADLEMSGDNYELAYRAIHDRYHNPRRIGAMYLRRIQQYVPLTSTSTPLLQDFLDVHQTSVSALKALPIADLTDFLLLSMSLSNLDASTRDAFEHQHASHPMPTYAMLMEFLTQRLRVSELHSAAGLSFAAKKLSPRPSTRLSASPLRQPSPPRASTRPAAMYQHPNSQCGFCKSDGHTIRQCVSFKRLCPSDRLRAVVERSICRNCLSMAHQSEQCRSQDSCHRCGLRHHTILHDQYRGSASTSRTAGPSSSPSSHHRPASPPSVSRYSHRSGSRDSEPTPSERRRSPRATSSASSD